MNGPRTHLDLQSSHRCIHPARLVTLVLFSSTLVACGMAQADAHVLVPAILIPGTIIFCPAYYFSIICCILCIENARINRRRATRATTFNARVRPVQQSFYPQATPSDGGSQPHPVQSNYPQPVPSQPPYTEPQQVSLPEATLHQGDAPPGYEEAVKFTTVNIDGQQNETSAIDQIPSWVCEPD